jgi:prophage maintenance system killer protein
VSDRLAAADLRFINRVASRRFAGGDPPPADEAAIDRVLATAAEGSAFERAAALVSSLLRDGVFTSVPSHTAVLVLHCSLAFDGLSLLAPQGVLVGMIRSLASGGDTDAFERWLVDRAVPSASGD